MVNMDTQDTSAATAAAGEAAAEPITNENGEQAVAAEPAVVSPKLSKKLKLKIDGADFDEELPFEIDENNKEQVDYLKRHLQMSKVANKRMSESAMTRKQAEQFIEMLQNDPMKILTHKNFGGEEKFQKLAEEFLSKRIQEQMLTPEERNQREREDKLRKYEEQEKQQAAETERKQAEELQTHYQESYTKTITEALSASNLPKNPYTVKRMAQLLQQNIKHGLELEPQHLAQLVREDYQRELSAIIGNSDPSQIISMFGEETVNKLRKHDLQALKKKLTPDYQVISKSSQSQESTPQKSMSREEWREEIQKRARE